MIDTLTLIVELTLRGGTPLALAALGGLVSERSGVVNIGLEGMILIGSFTAAWASLATGSVIIGLLAGMAAGGLLGLIHAVVTQRYKVDHIISGVALNLAALGFANYFFRFLGTRKVNLTSVPVLDWRWLTLLMVLLAIGLHYWLYNTVWGVRTQAVGNSAEKAAQMGVNPIKTRYWCVVVSGMLAGIGGVFLALDSSGYSENTSAGRGYIALAALIIGRWTPFGAAGAALAFGLFYQLESYLQSIHFGVKLPSQFWLALPYLLTLIALAGFLGKAKPPADLGNNA